MAFNLRVYGLLLNDRNEVLVSDERRFGTEFTKFPGGGMEYGESFQQTLIREFQEEIGIDIEVGNLFYFNEFFQDSAFHANVQLISFYYAVYYKNWQEIAVVAQKQLMTTDTEQQRWISLSALNEADFTFPIDKIVARKLKNQT